MAPPVAGFDPYAAGPGAGMIQPMTTPSAYGMGGYGSVTPSTGIGTPYYGGAASQPPPVINGGTMFGATTSGIPPIVPSNGSAFGAPVYGAPAGYGDVSSIYPSGAPSTLFPGGIMGTSGGTLPPFDPYRLFQRSRFRYSYIGDSDSDRSLKINYFDVAIAFAWSNFLRSTQPLFITPSFSLNLFDGPQSITGADLPAQTYSAFLDFSWQSDPLRIVGAELNFNFGGFSEFGFYNSDSTLFRGKAVGVFRITPASTFKIGIHYLDRVKVKILPAIGVLCRPNPFTKIDIYFPEPKYSHYLSTLGTQDLWWYIAGEYGGGSWTIKREDGREDQFDANDLRILLGFEWGPTDRMRAGLRSWHFELGYVGGREIVYRKNPQDNLDLSDAFILRFGVGF